VSENNLDCLKSNFFKRDGKNVAQLTLHEPNRIWIEEV